MSYGGYLIRQPLFWALLAGLAAGAALAAATWRTRRSRRPERTRARKWSLAWLTLSVAVAAVALGLILPPGVAIVRQASLWAAGAGLLVGGAGFRFPKSVGVPFLLILATVAMLGAWSVDGFRPVRTRVELAEISVLALREDEISLEVTNPGPDRSGVPEIVRVSPDELSFVVDVLDVNEALFLLGATRFVRYTGPGAPAHEAVSPVFEYASSLNLARLEQRAAQTPRLNVLRTYALTVKPVGPPELTVK